MSEKTVATQIIDFVNKHKEKVNKEAFAVIEFIFQNGKLDGMRIKEYIKNREKK